jgi:hypothetical protein
VEPSTDYTYDAVYRLISATGREHLGQNGGALSPPQQITNDDAFRTRMPAPGEGNAMGNYTEQYVYDRAGNILRMFHQVASGNWTRQYSYAEPGAITATDFSNRLSATSLPGDNPAGPYSDRYNYDEHGNMTRAPHLPLMVWSETDRLQATARQVLGAGVPETTYYTYDSGGQRIRKVTERQAGGVAVRLPARQSESISAVSRSTGNSPWMAPPSRWNAKPCMRWTPTGGPRSSRQEPLDPVRNRSSWCATSWAITSGRPSSNSTPRPK